MKNKKNISNKILLIGIISIIFGIIYSILKHDFIIGFILYGIGSFCTFTFDFIKKGYIKSLN
jgi:hypothetical protein